MHALFWIDQNKWASIIYKKKSPLLSCICVYCLTFTKCWKLCIFVWFNCFTKVLRAINYIMMFVCALCHERSNQANALQQSDTMGELILRRYFGIGINFDNTLRMLPVKQQKKNLKKKNVILTNSKPLYSFSSLGIGIFTCTVRVKWL